MMATRYPPIQVNIFTFPGQGMEKAVAVQDAFIAALKERALDELGPLDVHLMGWRASRAGTSWWRCATTATPACMSW